jgi:hypothetical protein
MFLKLVHSEIWIADPFPSECHDLVAYGFVLPFCRDPRDQGSGCDNLNRLFEFWVVLRVLVGAVSPLIRIAPPFPRCFACVAG